MITLKKQTGFTIVELLIVVVVIAILAAITIVAYNGISQRAKVSAVQSATTSAQKKLATYAIDNGDRYPATLAAAGVSNSDSTTYQYSVNNSTNPAGYCVTATLNNITYRIASQFTYTSGSSTNTLNDGTSQAGVCPGHVSNGGTAITNYARNPSVEISKTSLGEPNGATVSQSSVRAYQGTSSAIATIPASSSSGTSGVSYFQELPFVTLKPNTAYVASAYVYVPTGTNDVRIRIQGSGVNSAEDGAPSYATVRDQWVRVWNGFTTGPSGNITAYILNRYTTIASPTQFWADGFMLTEGSTPPTYADGNSPGWVWNGATGLSASSGPAL